MIIFFVTSGRRHTSLTCDWSSDVCSSDLFFFSSRRRHTRLTCDWSSDVCSSDLLHRGDQRVGNCAAFHLIDELEAAAARCGLDAQEHFAELAGAPRLLLVPVMSFRSEERRVGKECGCRWSPEH